MSISPRCPRAAAIRSRTPCSVAASPGTGYPPTSSATAAAAPASRSLTTTRAPAAASARARARPIPAPAPVTTTPAPPTVSIATPAGYPSRARLIPGGATPGAATPGQLLPGRGGADRARAVAWPATNTTRTAWRGPVLEPADRVHAAPDDPGLNDPEHRERQPQGPRLPAELGGVDPAVPGQLAGLGSRGRWRS